MNKQQSQPSPEVLKWMKGQDIKLTFDQYFEYWNGRKIDAPDSVKAWFKDTTIKGVMRSYMTYCIVALKDAPIDEIEAALDEPNVKRAIETAGILKSKFTPHLN